MFGKLKSVVKLQGSEKNIMTQMNHALNGKKYGCRGTIFKYKVWIMGCLFLFVVFGVSEETIAKTRPTIRALVVGGSTDGKTVSENISVERLKKYKDIGINYITVYSFARWFWSEKEPGKYEFTALGVALDNVRKAGLKAIVRLSAGHPPSWVFTYGKEQKLTEKEYSVCQQGGKIDFLEKLSVYPAIDANGNVVHNSGVDSWDATGNYLKLRYIANAVKYMQEKYSDVVDYVDAGMLMESCWILQSGIFTPTWSPTALDSYRRYLQEIYMDVSDANKIYKTNWKSFWEATPPKTYEDTKYFWDWRKWFERGMVTLFMREAAIVRRAGFKVNVMCHFVSTSDNPNPVASPNPATMWCGFNDPYRLELIDADLYVVGGGWNTITWKERDGASFDPSNNPLVMNPFGGYEIMRKKLDALYIIEDWAPNPILAEHIGLMASMLDGFQLMECSVSNLPLKWSTAEKEFEKLKDAINTFWLFGGSK